MLTKKKEQKPQATNQFNQAVAGNSLTRDAWRRLKKNKMAVISIFIVIIYILLALTAPILPIYPYDEIVLDHQNLPPSFTKSAGELLLDKKLADMYTQAWRNGSLTLTQAEDDMLWNWIDANETNKVWDYMLEKGREMSADGSFTFNAADQRRIERIEEKLLSELKVSINALWYTDPATGKREKLNSLNTEQLIQVYLDFSGTDRTALSEQYTKEIEQQILRGIKDQSPELSDDEYALLLTREIESLSDARMEALIKANILTKITNKIVGDANSQLKEMAMDDTVSFPVKEEISLNESISAEVEANRLNDRIYYLGTDYQGRDMLSRIIYGGQVSIAIGFVGTITSVLIGIILGALAGYLGGKVDYIIMRIVDIMYGLPYMLLVIIAMAIFGRNILNLFFALAIISWLTVSRMVRGQIMSLKNQEFIEAARSMGASTWRIIFKHLVPNSLSVIIVFSTLRIPAFIMTESFLSFLGLGVSAPFASWGSLVGDGVGSMALYPWKLFFPALAMTIFLFAMNFLGDGLRDAFDPQSKNQL